MLPNAIQDTIDEYLKEYERVTGTEVRIYEKVRYVRVSDTATKHEDQEFTLPELVRTVGFLKECRTHKSLQNPVETPETPKVK